jgi:predicted O-methyltransferase YrrM
VTGLVNAKSDGTTLTSHTYTYDPAGRMTTTAGVRPGGALWGGTAVEASQWGQLMERSVSWVACGRSDFWPALELFQALGGRVIVEIGGIRAEGPSHAQTDGHSTLAWAANAERVISVDIEPRATELTRRLTREYGNVTAVTQDGIEFLREFRGSIDLLYLDGWDAFLPESAERHLEAYRAARGKLHERSLILVDDTQDEAQSKGRLLVPQAEQEGWQVVFRRYQTLLARQLPEWWREDGEAPATAWGGGP